MLFSRRSATSACAIALIVMAVTPYHRFSSSIGLTSGAMTWLVILGACLAAFVHGAALRKRREIRRPGCLGVIGVFLGVIATVPEWSDLVFYARGDSIPFMFAPIWLLHGVSCASCFVGSLLLSYVIWDTAGFPLTQRATQTDEREARRPQNAIFTETIAALSCLLFCCRVSWRIVPEPWGAPSVSAATIGLVLLIPLVYLVLAVAPPLCCLRAFGRGQSDVFARSALVAVPIGLVPAVEAAYFASDAAIIALLAMGSAIAVAFVCTLLRGKRDNNPDIACTSDPFDAGVFSPALSPREEQFVRLLLKGKTPAEIAKETDTKPSTVRTTLHRAYGKASVAGSRELVALFAGEGDAAGPGLLQRHADDMLASARTRRLFRYLLTLFFILLAAGPLVMADSDWGSGVSWAVAFSLASYTLGLGLLLSLCSAGGKTNLGDDLDGADGADGAIGLGSPCVWAILSAVEWAFVYIAAWRCIRDPLMAAPVLVCGIASMASLAVKLRPFKVHAHTRAIVPLVSMGMVALIYAVARGRIHGFAVLTGMLLTYIVLRSCPQRKMLGVWMLCFGAMAPVWVVLLNMVQDLTVFEPLFLASLLGHSSAVNVVVATVIICWSVPIFVTHIALARSVEDEKAVLEYRANGSTETARVRQLALLMSRSLSDVQSQILLMTAEGATTKAIAEDVGYAASTVQALRSASYRQLRIKNKAELISLLSQVDNV
ncbi:helix-turn-helix transcriptional regulator [Collinsella aerofaciens]|uniref:helix-turn-helix transcriptional regulator n=1 Tax=Collinsella aerofaciens TaxID=74426 RepID=UPI001276317A|nr:LuxR C-terminal-related transcriptional regulator [Collinsella aerofaciens]VWL64292.1 Bacterial regulatory proteins, luxR family [Collinsella aerofaciens]